MITPRKLNLSLIGVWLVVVLAPSALAQNPPSSWTRQFGTAADDFAFGAAVDTPSVYVAGYQNDGPPGGTPPPCRTSAGSLNVEAFLRKYDVNGTHVPGFTSATADEVARGVTVDAGGNVYVVGENVATGEAFVRKYGPAGGMPHWTRQFGTLLVPAVAFGVAVNATGVYVAGHILDTLGGTDVIVRGYDPLGTLLWTQQFGTPALFDSARGVAADAAAVYAVGYTNLALTASNADAFVRKYDTATGTPLPWANQQFGTSSDDFGFGVTADGAAVYVAGYTLGSLAQGSIGLNDAFVRKYSLNGNPQWTDQFGTTSDDFALGVAAGVGGIFVGGYTGGALPGETQFGQSDAYVRKYNSSGNDVWTTQFGSDQHDAVWAVAAHTGSVYASGCTSGALTGQTNLGGADAFLVKNPQRRVNVGGPDNSSNTIKVGSNRIVPVAIMSTAAFDATTVDPTSITLAGATVRLKGNGTYHTSAQDVNGDGLLDLVVQVTTEALQLSENDTEAVLEGMTFTGQAIRGKYFVRVVP